MKGVKSSPAIHIHIYPFFYIYTYMYIHMRTTDICAYIYISFFKTHRERHVKTNDKERMPLSGKFNIPCFCMM